MMENNELSLKARLKALKIKNSLISIRKATLSSSTKQKFSRLTTIPTKSYKNNPRKARKTQLLSINPFY
jgi:hypothetical protein